MEICAASQRLRRPDLHPQPLRRCFMRKHAGLLQVLIAAQQLLVLQGLGLLAWLVWERYSRPEGWWLESGTLAAVNLGTGALCLLCLLPCGGLYAVRTLQAHRQRRRWYVPAAVERLQQH